MCLLAGTIGNAFFRHRRWSPLGVDTALHAFPALAFGCACVRRKDIIVCKRVIALPGDLVHQQRGWPIKVRCHQTNITARVCILAGSLHSTTLKM